MSRLSKITDLYYQEQGDYMLGPDGDIADTANDAYRGLVQHVDAIMQSSFGDWKLQPELGANLTSFVGKANNKRIADTIQRTVETQLLREGILRPMDFEIKVIPISSSALTVIIFITRTENANKLILNYTYDLRDNKIASRIRR